MKIKIGNKNKFKNSVIGEKITINKPREEGNFAQRHPVLIALLTSFIVGFILLFSFWKDVIDYFEGFFK